VALPRHPERDPRRHSVSTDRLRRQHRYAVTPEGLILDPAVSDRAVRLWCRLDRYAGNDEAAYPTRETLSIELDCGRGSVDRARNELVEAGWLEVTRRHGGSDLYTVLSTPPEGLEERIAASREERRAARAPRLEAARQNRRDKRRSQGGVLMGGDTTEEGGVTTHGITGVTTHATTVSPPIEHRRKQQEEASLEGLPPTPHAAPAVQGAPAEEDVPRPRGGLDFNRGRGTRTPPPADAAAEPSAPTGPAESWAEAAPPGFLAFWAAYPSSDYPDAALRAWRRRRLEDHAADITAAAQRYADDPNRVQAWTKGAASWLNDGGWRNGPLPARSAGSRGEADQRRHDDLFAAAAERFADRDAADGGIDIAAQRSAEAARVLGLDPDRREIGGSW